MRLDLLGDQVALGDLALFVLGIASKRDDLHPVQQRAGHVIAVGRGQEHHVRQIVFHFQIVVDEGRVLFRVQHLKHRTGRVTAEILAHLVDFIKQDQRVGGLGLFQRLDDLAGHRADIGATVAADLGFVAHAAQADADELAPRGLGDRAPQRGLAHARRADEAQDRPLQLGRARLHRQIFDDPLLDLFQPVVIGVQNRLRGTQILFHARFHAPRHAQQPVEIIAHHGRLGAHGRHGFQLFQLSLGLVAGLLGQLGVLDARLQLVEFGLAFLALAQLLLDRLHLLVQIVFALRALHLAFHAALDLALDLQDRQLALHVAIDLFQPLGDVKFFQKLLLLRDRDAQMAGHEVGQTRGLAGVGHRGQRLLGDVLLDLGVTLELFRNRAHQRVGGVRIPRHLDQRLAMGLEEVGIGDEFGDLHPRLALDQHLDGAVGQFQQLQHIGQDAHAIDPVIAGLVHGGVDLAGEQDLPILGHHLFQRPHGFLAPHEKRHDHVRENHDVAQRQHRVADVNLFAHVIPSGRQARPRPSAATTHPSTPYLGACH